jgi:hypothetical protein
MGDDPFDFEENISRMIAGKKGILNTDEELALHIIHRFNICRDTLESMPALEKHLEPLFFKEKCK